MDLTKRQKEIFDYIRKHAARTGYPPTVREIGNALRLHSSSTVHAHLEALQSKGYIRKDAAGPDIVQAIRTVLQKGRYMSQTVSEMLVNRLDSGAERPLHQDLSEREFQVLCAIASGKTVSAIAEQLFISVKTVTTHRGHILHKLGVHSIVDLVRYAARHGRALD